MNVHPPFQNIVILGTGAMASLFAGHLQRVLPTQPNSSLTLFGTWEAQIARVTTAGLQVVGLDGTIWSARLSATSQPGNLPAADLVFLLGKSHQTEKHAKIAKQILTREGLAISIQNGLGNLESLEREVGRERAAAGVTSQGAYLAEPGQLVHAGAGPTYLATSGGNKTALKDVIDLLDRAGLDARATNDLHGMLWAKCVVNAAINPLTALLEVRNGALPDDADAWHLMTLAAREAVAVAQANGLRLPFSEAESEIARVCRSTAENRSSMLQDILSGRRTEIDAINGAIVKAGERLSVPTPVNTNLLCLVKAKEAGTTVTREMLFEFEEHESL